jgi:hypothetical protein
MRGAWGCLAVLLLAFSAARAEPPAVLVSPDAPHAAAEPPVTAAIGIPNAMDASPAGVPAHGLQHFVDAKLLLGLPTGLLLQFAVDRQEQKTWLAEAFAGIEAFNAAFGLGGRVLYTPATGKSGDSLVLGPGLEFIYFQGDHSTDRFWFTSDRDGYFFIPNVEVAWLHDFADHFGWELGLDLGVGVAFWSNDSMDSNRKSVTVVPLLSVFTGFNF